jgi:hypothetical protein
MKAKSIIGSFIILLAASACSVQSLHPLYSEEVLVYDDDLEGDWLDDDGRLWSLENALRSQALDSGSQKEAVRHNKMYLASYKDEKDSLYAFELHLVRLGKYFFVDIFPWEKYNEKLINEFMVANLLPVHTFAKMEVRGDSLFLSQINGEWVSDLIKNNQIRISHEKLMLYGDTEIVLTASTQELQKFLLKYQNDPQAYVQPDVFVRKH